MQVWKGGSRMPSEKIVPLTGSLAEAMRAIVTPRNFELPQLPSERLFQGHREILILHHNETYRLRITKTNKLILTK